MGLPWAEPQGSGGFVPSVCTTADGRALSAECECRGLVGLYLVSVPLPQYTGNAFLSLQVYKKMTVSLLRKIYLINCFCCSFGLKLPIFFLAACFSSGLELSSFAVGRPKYAILNCDLIFFKILGNGSLLFYHIFLFSKRQLLLCTLNIKS